MHVHTYKYSSPEIRFAVPKYFLLDILIVMKRSKMTKRKKPLSKKETNHTQYGDTGKRPMLSSIVGLGKSGSKKNAVALKKRIQRGEI